MTDRVNMSSAEMETQILCGQQGRGIRSGVLAEDRKRKRRAQMPSYKFTQSLFNDL